MLTLWLATGLLAGQEAPAPVQPPVGGAGSSGGLPPRRRGPRLIFIDRTTRKAAERARDGEADEAVRLAQQAAEVARQEAARAEREDAEALEAIAQEIIAAGERVRAAEAKQGFERLQAIVAFEAALAAITEMRLQAQEDEAVTLLLLI